VNALARVIVHTLAVIGLLALVQHFQTPKLKYSDDALIDDTGVTLEKRVTHRI
jgi:hypothetical protein